jgi:hypothetical protein
LSHFKGLVEILFFLFLNQLNFPVGDKTLETVE